MKKLSIVFAGTPVFGLASLQALAKSGHEILAVYTQPDRPAGRGRKLQASEIKIWAQAQNIPVFQPENFKDEQTVAQLAALKPDLMVVIAYGLILPRKVLAIPRLGCVNVHASLLPRWRGAAPIQYAILKGDAESGVTIMQMDAGMDTGNMLRTAHCVIEPQDTAQHLHDKLALLAIEPLLETLDALANHTAKPIQQAHELASYAGKINKEDARINWQTTAIEIDRQIRAFNPWPVAFTQNADETIRVYQAKVEPFSQNVEPGTIIRIDKNGILVSCAKDAICIERFQFAGGKVLAVADWMNAGQAERYLHLILS